ncbi:MAG TPA: polysaccharide (de)acetylase [Flavobacterium sp.]|jgi:hypothetical protein
MSFKNLKHIASRNLLNSKGATIRHKLVVFESDDWGTIRMSSKKAYADLLKNYPIDQCHFSKNDMLESNDDLEFLMETLSSVKGADGLPAKFTLNNIMANPDFEKIRAGDFREYYYEPFVKTLERYPNHDKVLEYYKEGLRTNLFQMQFHGREHVHVPHWMSALQNGHKTAREIFQYGIVSIFESHETSTCNNEFLNGMAAYNDKDFEFISKSVIDGAAMFESVWGFKSKSVIAPCYNWHPDLEGIFSECGISLIQGGKAQLCPSDAEGVNVPITHFFGEQNRFKQRYLVRNVHFEPSTNPSANWIDKALTEIGIAFLWNKPALVSTHRLNFIGGLVQENRDKNLAMLKLLLEKIIKKWPDVRFISTDELENYLPSSED